MRTAGRPDRADPGRRLSADLYDAYACAYAYAYAGHLGNGHDADSRARDRHDHHDAHTDAQRGSSWHDADPEQTEPPAAARTAIQGREPTTTRCEAVLALEARPSGVSEAPRVDSPSPRLGPFKRPLALRHVDRVPEHCVWEITNACNLNCVHCESESGCARESELSTSEALALCDDLKALGCRVVNLSGGEPFLRPDWVQICERLVALELEPVLVSNLTFADEGHFDALARLGVEWVATSVDGPEEVHDRIRRTRGETWSAFARTHAGIRELKARGHSVAVITHVSLWNLQHMDELAGILEQLGIDLWQLQLGQPSGRLREIAASYLIYPRQIEDIYAFIRRVQQTRRLTLDVADDIGFFGLDELEVRMLHGEPRFFAGCQAGFRALSISSDGAVRGCPSLEIDVGNIRQTPLAEIWADEKRFWFNHWDPSKIEGNCRRCPFLRICRCGCKSLALSTTGSIHRNIYCLNQIKNLGGDPDRREVDGVAIAGCPPECSEPTEPK